jgi:hypothetical protein
MEEEEEEEEEAAENGDAMLKHPALRLKLVSPLREHKGASRVLATAVVMESAAMAGERSGRDNEMGIGEEMQKEPQTLIRIERGEKDFGDKLSVQCGRESVEGAMVLWVLWIWIGWDPPSPE